MQAYCHLHFHVTRAPIYSAQDSGVLRSGVALDVFNCLLKPSYDL